MKKFIKRKIKKLLGLKDLHYIQNKKATEEIHYIINKYVTTIAALELDWEFSNFSKDVIKYIKALDCKTPFTYKFAQSIEQSTIYASIYSCMLYFLLNKSDEIPNKDSWVKYFDSFQTEDGFFIDKKLINSDYFKIDWWGAHHIGLHIIICYKYLCARPKYQFNYVKKYYDKNTLSSFLNTLEFDDLTSVDTDNAIMNLGAIFQYQRDFFNDEKAGEAMLFLYDELEKRINPEWGSWGYGDRSIQFLSRTQQFAYHLYPLWFYDNKPVKHIEKLIDLCLEIQTVFGGFGSRLNTSACEDIDSIDMLIKLSELTEYRKNDIELALKKAFVWVLSNQNDDGGFVFRRNEKLLYGHDLTSSAKNESNLFSTWFRTLSIAYMANYLKYDNNFNIGRCPGLQF